MSKKKSIILLAVFLILVLVSSYCFATGEDATTTEEEEVVTTSETEEDDDDEYSEWTNSDLYVMEDVVTISNVVDGNAFVVGKDVTVTGEIGGDLFVLADKLTIDGGYVYSSIFACANEITINGVVYDVYATCNTFNLGSSGFIYRDMRVTASDVNMNGRIRRDAYISAQNINFSENTETVIYGNLEYSSDTEIAIPEGAVSGEVTYGATNSDTTTTLASTILSYVSDLFTTLFFTFIVTLVLLWLTPKFIERIGKISVAKSFASLGIGLLAPIVLIIVGILLLISSIGAPIFVVGTFAFIVLALIGNSIASIFFGKLLTNLLKMDGNVKFVLFTLVSCLIIWAISQIPVIGGFFSFIIVLFGIGLTLVNMVWKKEMIEETKSEAKE